MAKQSHQPIIELNGQRYNAHTGKIIDGVSTPIAQSQPTPVSAPMISVPANKPAQRNSTPSKQIHRRTQPSRTLMRSAVKKPSAITNHQTVSMDVVPMPGQTAATIFHKPSTHRLHRAQAIPQNSLINRFGGELKSGKPAHHTAHPITQATAPTPSQAAASLQVAAHAHHAAAVTKIVDKGLREATSHQKAAHPHKKPRLHHRIGKRLGLSRRAASIAAGSFAVLIFGAFFAYQNVPNIAVRYAAAKAGVHASLPSYQPAGFAVNSHVNYSPGQVTISYKANADNRAYTVTQQNTNWNSEILKEHLTTAAGSTPQSYPDSGRTIYLHDDAKADWVEGGVWYSISGDASLNTDQLIKIATSI